MTYHCQSVFKTSKMNTIKHGLSLLFLLSTITIFAQSGYEIHNTTVSEKFNNENKLQSRHIWASGVRDEEILNVDFIVDANNVVKELTINDKVIAPPMFSAFKDLTNYVVKYIDGEIENPKTKTNPTEKEKLTESDKKALMDLIKNELIKLKFRTKIH